MSRTATRTPAAKGPRSVNTIRRRHMPRVSTHELLLLLLYRNLAETARQDADRLVWEAWTQPAPRTDVERRATNRRFRRELRALKAGSVRSTAFDRFCAPWMPADAEAGQ